MLKIAGKHPLAYQMKAQIEFDKKEFQSAREFGTKAYQMSDRFSLAIILHLLGGYSAASIVTLLVAVLAALEFAVNFCVGCVIYSTLVFPFFAKN